MEANRAIVPRPVNEPARDYAPGSADKRGLKEALAERLSSRVEIPLVIGGTPVTTGSKKEIRCPHEKTRLLGVYHAGGPEEADAAIKAALAARPTWEATPWTDRAAVFLKAAELLAGRYRYEMLAATMLGQSKTVFQAEIDAGCELVDYLRFNTAAIGRIYSDRPDRQAPACWTRLDFRPLDGFVFAVTPFNFTAIAGNLPSAPAMMGNTVVWKPASTAVLSAHVFMRILAEAGLPSGVVNMVPGRGADVAEPVIDHKDLAGVHFTGSNGVFESIWHRVGVNVSDRRYRNYPRLVGETGGKGFVVAAPDADPVSLGTALFRASFEYQGQKCSAASRAYIPRSLWPAVRSRVADLASNALVGEVTDFRTFMGAVIDKPAFDTIVSYIEYARSSSEANIVVGGTYDDSRGYFIRPTVIETSAPRFKTMEEEIFGPVLTVYVFADREFEKTLELVDATSPYALTGAVFARDRRTIRLALDALAHAAGNICVNDKPTGAVVGQQPFGGARMSGTNDKAGSYLNLLRWTSPRTIKECFDPPQQADYPHMAEA